MNRSGKRGCILRTEQITHPSIQDMKNGIGDQCARARPANRVFGVEFTADGRERDADACLVNEADDVRDGEDGEDDEEFFAGEVVGLVEDDGVGGGSTLGYCCGCCCPGWHLEWIL